jgi:benzoyl-CoA-dihydrodiol lyase
MTDVAPASTLEPAGPASGPVQHDQRPERGDIEFRVDGAEYRHWRLACHGPVAVLGMDVDEKGGLAAGYELKLNSYDLGVDIELYDIVQRLRFEHPEVRAVVLTSAKDRIFSAGANIRMLAASSHAFKVNFCKFTNETRNAIEDATEQSGQTWVAAVNGTASGGGYELALACQHIMLVDDRTSAVSLPELPLLGVLPGTGGLTRLVDKRHVRRDLADYLATRPEGAKGQRALTWRLVDELAARPQWEEAVQHRALEVASRSSRTADGPGCLLTRLDKSRSADAVAYPYLSATLDRDRGIVDITVSAPDAEPPPDPAGLHRLGADFWSLAVFRALDDLVLDLRTNEPELGIWVFRTKGDPAAVLAYDRFLLDHRDDWLANEILHYLKRTLKRLDVTSRTLFACIEPGSCFAGSLLELALAADRSFQLDGMPEAGPGGSGDRATAPVTSPAAIVVDRMNLGPLPMANGLTRLQSRFFGNDDARGDVEQRAGSPLTAADAVALGLVTFAPDDLDWDDELRLALEERASFSPDAVTAMEANCRFVGPETVETKIFGRLSTWQNWVFSRPNATGADGALRRYGTGLRAEFDRTRV